MARPIRDRNGRKVDLFARRRRTHSKCSAAVLAAYWTIDACTIELGRGEPISETCRGEKTFGEGRVVIRGTKTITGLFTGDSNQPVIPDGPEAARLELLAELDRFAARSASRTPALTMVSGKISWSVSPRLAASASKGICMVPTMDAAFSDIRYHGAKVYVESGERSLFVDVPRSSFWAQVGRSGDRENWLEGEITVWDATVHLPTRDDQRGLDPSYDRAHFIESYACRPTSRSRSTRRARPCATAWPRAPRSSG